MRRSVQRRELGVDTARIGRSLLHLIVGQPTPSFREKQRAGVCVDVFERIARPASCGLRAFVTLGGLGLSHLA